MPLPEQFYKSRPVEAPQTNHGEFSAQPTTSPRMEQVVTNLAAHYNIDLSQKGTIFNLDVPDHQQRWLIGNIDGERVGVSRLKVDKDNGLMAELDMVFDVNPTGGWEPIEIMHTPEVWRDYVEAVESLEQSAVDAHGDFDFVAFSDHIAEKIEQQGWLARQVDEQGP